MKSNSVSVYQMLTLLSVVFETFIIAGKAVGQLLPSEPCILIGVYFTMSKEFFCEAGLERECSMQRWSHHLLSGNNINPSVGCLEALSQPEHLGFTLKCLPRACS